MYRKILCAVDGSNHALRAARVAAGLAAAAKAELTLLTVAKELKVTEEVKRYLALEQMTGEPQYVLDEHTEAVIQRAKETAAEAGVALVKSEVRSGPPARSIVRFAEQGGYDVIVLGSRGLGDIEAALLGSVSHKVSSLAKCDCLLVR